MAEHVTTVAVVMLTIAATLWLSVALVLLAQTVRRLTREWSPADLGDELEVLVHHTRTVTPSTPNAHSVANVAGEHAL